jgi:hypothetical protein
MSEGQRHATRRWLALGLALSALLLSGCVYLRFLELKKQLGRFDQFFSLRTTDGLTLICHSPVLRTDDIRWIGVKPETAKRLGRAEQWEVRWVKQLPPGVTENASYDIAIEMSFVDGKLARATVPERYFALMPKTFITGVIKSVGSGRVDKAQKGIDATVSGADVAAARPSLPSIDKLLGRPTEEKKEGANTMVRYRYIPVSPEPDPGVFEMRLTFETQSGELLKWLGITPVGRIGFDFTADRKKK